MTPCHRSFVALLLLAVNLSAASAATTKNHPNSQHQHLRRVADISAARPANEKSVRQRRLEEALEVVTNPVEQHDASEQQGGDEPVTNEKQEETEATPNERESKSTEQSASGDASSSDDKQGNDSNANTDHVVPSATMAGREAEDPILAEEDTASTILLDISLSLTAQRFLGLLAAIAGMIFTAYSMSENPDGLYASLCRSILTGIRVLCQVVTCKGCFFGDGRSRAAHRHIPIDSFDTWSVDIDAK